MIIIVLRFLHKARWGIHDMVMLQVKLNAKKCCKEKTTLFVGWFFDTDL
jgi:hypothetical protein